MPTFCTVAWRQQADVREPDNQPDMSLTIEGSDEAAVRAAAWRTFSACAQVPLRDQRRNCDQTRVHDPNDCGR
jgi:hypothetical protein